MSDDLDTIPPLDTGPALCCKLVIVNCARGHQRIEPEYCGRQFTQGHALGEPIRENRRDVNDFRCTACRRARVESHILYWQEQSQQMSALLRQGHRFSWDEFQKVRLPLEKYQAAEVRVRRDEAIQQEMVEAEERLAVERAQFKEKVLKEYQEAHDARARRARHARAARSAGSGTG